MELKQVRQIAVGEFGGEPGFGARLVRALAGSERLEVVEDPEDADAVLEAWSEHTEEGFAGGLMLSDRNGNTIWSDQAVRPHGAAGPMAYEQLVTRLLNALDH